MIVSWTPEALADRRAIHLHIREDNPSAAIAMDELFEAAVQRLATTPRIGRPGLIEGTRELIPHENYRVVYEIVDDTVWVLALVHARRQWPPVG
jgi:addiction module RelE/StbE family toxin